MSNISCHACGKPRRKKMLGFTEKFVPYCSSYWLCNEKHPNHPANPDKQALFPPDKVKANENIQALMTKPFSMRIGDYATCKFLVDLQQEKGFKSMSDTVRFCLDEMQKDHVPIPKPQPEPQPQQQPKQDLEEWTF